MVIDDGHILVLRSIVVFSFFFFNDTATTEIYTLSLHDALPISMERFLTALGLDCTDRWTVGGAWVERIIGVPEPRRSEEHTSELQSRQYLVCRLLLEKKKKTSYNIIHKIHLIDPNKIITCITYD